MQADLAVLQHVTVRADVERDARILLDQQDRHAVGMDAPDDREHLLDQDRREPEARLVEQAAASAAPSARVRSSASAARRPRACRRAASRAPSAAGNSRRRAPARRDAGLRRCSQAPSSRLSADAQLGKDLAALRAPARCRARRCPSIEQAATSSPSKRMRPTVERHDAGNAVERRGLAGAVRAQQADDLAGRDGERDAFERADRAVARGDGLELKHARPCRDRPRSPAGRCGSRLGVPSAIFWPKLSTVMRSATAMTSCITCSTSTMVMLLLAREIDQQRVERRRSRGCAGRRPARRAAAGFGFGGERAREVEHLLVAEIELARPAVAVAHAARCARAARRPRERLRARRRLRLRRRARTESSRARAAPCRSARSPARSCGGSSSMFWKVRAMPRAAMPCGGSGSSERPSNRMSPSDWAVEARHAVEHRGLAGAVRADQRMDRALRHVHRETIERAQSAEAHVRFLIERIALMAPTADAGGRRHGVSGSWPAGACQRAR